ncbi:MULTISPECIES: c-type cytochrome [Marinobacter]|uniref:c-type cytochrome n=1 Tax=Marinobacter TaxID=2742 RepID=UPI001D0634E4|nr:MULTISPECIES: c-type cytochrome [Marinobacter]MCG8519829.1 c-type cytochrome [Pseudomonadales bacterium]MCK7565224.1 c-type cytochrome [Marinobacter xestospongiae]UDL06017.1 c-type cytochrome [Marinobacter sp. CA1]
MKPNLIPILAVLPLLAAPVAQASDGEALFKSKPCAACHAVDTKMVGPALTEIAAKYSDQEGAVDTLADHIKNGTQGNWGPVPMPPNPVTEEEARTLAEWVLEH